MVILSGGVMSFCLRKVLLPAVVLAYFAFFTAPAHATTHPSSPSQGGKEISSKSSWSEITNYFSIPDARVSHGTKTNAYNAFKITAREWKLMKDRFGDNFFVVEFFFRVVHPYQVKELLPAIKTALAFAREHPNVMVKGWMVEDSIDVAVPKMMQMSRAGVIDVDTLKEFAPVPDVYAWEAHARGVKRLPSMVITQGFGKNSDVLTVTSHYNETLKKVLALKLSDEKGLKK